MALNLDEHYLINLFTTTKGSKKKSWSLISYTQIRQKCQFWRISFFFFKYFELYGNKSEIFKEMSQKFVSFTMNNAQSNGFIPFFRVTEICGKIKTLRNQPIRIILQNLCKDNIWNTDRDSWFIRSKLI